MAYNPHVWKDRGEAGAIDINADNLNEMEAGIEGAHNISSANTTILTIVGEIAAGVDFSTTSSGISYTKSEDDGDLKASAALFKAAEFIIIMLNGVYMIKGTHAIWQSQTSFQLNTIVDSGDEIIILS